MCSRGIRQHIALDNVMHVQQTEILWPSHSELSRNYLVQIYIFTPFFNRKGFHYSMLFCVCEQIYLMLFLLNKIILAEVKSFI